MKNNIKRILLVALITYSSVLLPMENQKPKDRSALNDLCTWFGLPKAPKRKATESIDFLQQNQSFQQPQSPNVMVVDSNVRHEENPQDITVENETPTHSKRRKFNDSAANNQDSFSEDGILDSYIGTYPEKDITINQPTHTFQENNEPEIDYEETENTDVTEKEKYTKNADGRYACIYVEGCNKTFAHKSGIHRHIKLAHHGVEYPCVDCPKKFKSQRSLNRHIQLEHSEPLYTFICDIDNCGEGFDNQQSLEGHKKLKHFICPLNSCKKNFLNKKKLRTHIKSEHNCSFICECQKKYQTSSAYNKHYKAAHLGVRHICKVVNCKKEYVSKAKLDHHTVMKHSKNKYICNVCYENCIDQKSLKKHKKLNHTEKHMCEFCKIEFASENNVKRHLKKKQCTGQQ